MKFKLVDPRRLLPVAFTIAMLSTAICGAVEYWGMVRLDRAARGVRHGDTALANATEDMREDILELRRYEKDVFMNIGSDELVRQYRDKWDRAFVGLRYDLERARRVDPTLQDSKLQQVTDQLAAYRVAYIRIYDAIANGTIRTTQQANEEMSPFKSSVRDAENLLIEISGDARDRQPLLGPAVVAQQVGLAVSLLLLLALAGLYVGYLRQSPAENYA